MRTLKRLYTIEVEDNASPEIMKVAQERLEDKIIDEKFSRRYQFELLNDILKPFFIECELARKALLEYQAKRVDIFDLLFGFKTERIKKQRRLVEWMDMMESTLRIYEKYPQFFEFSEPKKDKK